MYGKILVPIDGSETSTLGLDEAIKIAKAQGSHLRLVHIVNEFILGYTDSLGLYANTVIEALQEGGKKILNQAEARVRQQGIALDSVLLESIGGAKLWPADLIVMGTHGRRGLVRVALGSDAEQVVRAATVPVMLVRGTPQRRRDAYDAEPAGAYAA
jgi:nucleotide-binding universal stress UspA family protein